jgi:hypothetical protein
MAMDNMNLNLQGWDTKGTIVSPELLFRVIEDQYDTKFYKLVYFTNCSESVWLPCSQKYFAKNKGIYLDSCELEEGVYIYYYIPTLGE